MPEQTTEKIHPCLRCGACCAYFRASFYWAEADDATPGGVPAAMTRKLNDHRRSMIGMDGEHPRCVALQGENGLPNERCDRARAAWGLDPLTPQDWGT